MSRFKSRVDHKFKREETSLHIQRAIGSKRIKEKRSLKYRINQNKYILQKLLGTQQQIQNKGERAQR